MRWRVKRGVLWLFPAIGAGLLAYGAVELVTDGNGKSRVGEQPGGGLTRPFDQSRAPSQAARDAPVQSEMQGAIRRSNRSAPLDVETVRASLVAPASTRVGEHVVIAINLESTSVAMASIAVKLRYDGSRLRLVSMNAGDIMMQCGVDSNFRYEERADGGEVRAVLDAIDSAGVTGAGSVTAAEFEAIAEGPAMASLEEVQAADAAGALAPAAGAASSARVLIGP